LFGENIMSQSETDKYTNYTTKQLEELLNQPGSSKEDQQLIQEELTKRIEEELLLLEKRPKTPRAPLPEATKGDSPVRDNQQKPKPETRTLFDELNELTSPIEEVSPPPLIAKSRPKGKYIVIALVVFIVVTALVILYVNNPGPNGLGTKYNTSTPYPTRRASYGTLRPYIMVAIAP
jgi:hypothetical protein